MRAIEFRVESVSISRLSDSDRDAWVPKEFSKEWILSLVVRKVVNANVDEPNVPECVELKHWDAQQVLVMILCSFILFIVHFRFLTLLNGSKTVTKIPLASTLLRGAVLSIDFECGASLAGASGPVAQTLKI